MAETPIVTAQESFLRVLPELKRGIQVRLRKSNPEQMDEDSAAALSWAWKIHLKKVSKGEFCTGYTLAHYAMAQVRRGQTIAGTTAYELYARTSPHKQEQLVEFSSDDIYQEFSHHRQDCSAYDYVQPSMDYQKFYTQCTRPQQLLLSLRKRGVPLSAIADRLGLGYRGVTSKLQRLHAKYTALTSARRTLPGRRTDGTVPPGVSFCA
jgi:hypothetical protein